MIEKFSRGGTITLGAMEVLDAKKIREIFEMAK